jgi:hypothetical protein
MQQEPRVDAATGAEVEPGGRREEDELRDARLGKLEVGYQTCSVITARMKIAASGSGTSTMSRR